MHLAVLLSILELLGLLVHLVQVYMHILEIWLALGFLTLMELEEVITSEHRRDRCIAFILHLEPSFWRLIARLILNCLLGDLVSLKMLTKPVNFMLVGNRVSGLPVINILLKPVKMALLILSEPSHGRLLLLGRM